MPSAGQLLLEHHLNVNVRAGTGSGRQHAFDKNYRGRPFPMRDGCIARFQINFAPGFEWGCRGKIGGIHIGPGYASGCRFSDNGASHRLMWDAGGGGYAYVYLPLGTFGGQPGPLKTKKNCGMDVWKQEFRGVFQPGKWHTVELGVKLNTPGRYDGTIMMAIDGRRYSLNGVMWRKGNETIDSFGVGVFHGGPCSATRNSSLQIQNITVQPWG